MKNDEISFTAILKVWPYPLIIIGGISKIRTLVFFFGISKLCVENQYNENPINYNIQDYYYPTVLGYQKNINRYVRYYTNQLLN